MSTGDEFAPAIKRMMDDIARMEEEAAELKRTVNKLCGYAGRPTAYANIEVNKPADVSNLRRDQFFGVPLATAVRDYLNMRGDPKAGGLGAATVNEIFTALREGGFHFDTKNDENAKRGLRISLAKNVAAFTKVPGGSEGAFGLAEWYPGAKAKGETTVKPPANEPPPDQENGQGPSSLSSDVSAADQSDDASEHIEKGE